MNHIDVIVEDLDSADIRIDKYIAEYLQLFPRSQIKSRSVAVRLNGKEAKLSKHVTSGDYLEIYYSSPTLPDIKPEKIELSILFENHDVIVIDKPQGMVVHPAVGNYSGTLMQGLMYYCSALKIGEDSGMMRPGIVHRLDKETSGVLITAKNIETQSFLASQFKERKTEKKYLAILKGTPSKPADTITSGIIRDKKNRKKFTFSQSGGKEAVTSYKVLQTYGKFCFVGFKPLTGRTHQIRVHSQMLGCPILGDPVYARNDNLFRDATLMLHAYSLNIKIPGFENPYRFFAPLPERFKAVLRVLSSTYRHTD